MSCQRKPPPASALRRRAKLSTYSRCADLQGKRCGVSEGSAADPQLPRSQTGGRSRTPRRLHSARSAELGAETTARGPMTEDSDQQCSVQFYHAHCSQANSPSFTVLSWTELSNGKSWLIIYRAFYQLSGQQSTWSRVSQAPSPRWSVPINKQASERH